MLGILTEIVSKARSDSPLGKRWAGLRPNGTDVDDQDTEPESTLFECQSCETVYVATEKNECGECNGPVSPIESSTEPQTEQ